VVVPQVREKGLKGLFLELLLNGEKRVLLLDSGSEVSILKRPLGGAQVMRSRVAATGVTGSPLPICGQQELTCQWGGNSVRHTFLIAQVETSHDGLLGWDLMSKWGMTLDAGAGEVSLNSRGKSRDVAHVSGQEERETHVAHLGVGVPDWAPVWARRNASVAPMSEQLIEARVGVSIGRDFVVEPVDQPQVGLRVARSLHSARQGDVVVKVVNLTSKEIVVDHKQVLGWAEPLDREEDSCGNGTKTSRKRISKRRSRACLTVNGGAWDEKVDEKLAHLPERERGQLKELIARYRETFGEPGPEGCSLPVAHRIVTLEGSGPVVKRPYKVPHYQKEVVRAHLDEMLSKGIISESDSPYSAPVVIVQKKTSDGTAQTRFCTDFRGLNQITRADPYPLPLIVETLESLGQCRYFTTLDLASGYHQIPVEPADREKTAFTTLGAHYQYNKMPFGLVNAPATFQRVMDRVLCGIKGMECLVYLDDVIIYSSTFGEHCERLHHVLDRLQRANLKIKLEKCEFAKERVKYLGHLVTADGVQPDPDKITAVKEYPRPQTIKDVRAYLGLAGYYRRFVSGFADIAKPLTSLLKKEGKFVWGPEQELAFNQLKESLCSDAVLIYPEFTEEFILATDASGHAIGAVLSQIRDGHERPIAYASRQLNPAESRYSTTERELLAVVWATAQFRCYLLGRKFRLVTDHSALCWMLSLKDPSARLTRWALRLSEFTYSVEHKPGKRHSNADGLSRRSAPIRLQSELPSDEEWIRFQESDGWCRTIVGGDREGIGQSDKGVWYREEASSGRKTILVPEALRPTVISSYHDPPWQGHPGVERTILKIRSRYHWPSLSGDVERYVKGCEKCQRRKTPVKLKPPLQEPEHPRYPFQQVSIDVVGPLPRTSRGYRYLLTLIDQFSKYAEAVPLVGQTAEEVARAFVENLVLRHGVPAQVVTDQGRNFTSNLFREVCRLLGTKKVQTTAYHPQSNGIVERFHRTLADMLSHYVRRGGRDWDDWLPFALAAYRSLPHSSTGYTPNFLLYGHELPEVNETDLTVRNGESYDEYIRTLWFQLTEARQIARGQLVRAYERRAKQANKGRKYKGIKVSDWVYLFDPLEQGKFKKPWKGPYRVVGQKSPVTYQIEMAEGKAMWVHEARLKPARGRASEPECRQDRIEIDDLEGKRYDDSDSDEEDSEVGWPRYDEWEEITEREEEASSIPVETPCETVSDDVRAPGGTLPENDGDAGQRVAGPENPTIGNYPLDLERERLRQGIQERRVQHRWSNLNRRRRPKYDPTEWEVGSDQFHEDVEETDPTWRPGAP